MTKNSKKNKSGRRLGVGFGSVLLAKLIPKHNTLNVSDNCRYEVFNSSLDILCAKLKKNSNVQKIC